MHRTLAFLALFVAVPNSLATTPAELPAFGGLADPFTFNDGRRVTSAADWEKRREELKQLFAEYEYGHLPPKLDRWNQTDAGFSVDEATGATTIKQLATFFHDGRELSMLVTVVLPKGADNVPVVIQPSTGALRPQEPSEKKSSPLDFSKQFTDRGYAYAEFMAPEVAIDNRDTSRESGIYKLFGEDIDCGTLMAWAWGFHRTIDLLENISGIDMEKIVVTGHSRYGKAALVAGAFDERIAVTAPSHSGCAGIAPFRFIYGNSEQLQNIAGAFPYWFRPGFGEFSDQVDKLPVDQHLLRALVAPRAQISTEGTEDAWSNPQGAQLTYLAAKEVYKFLGAADKITIRTRQVKHIPNNDDVMDFADHVFFGKSLSEDFGKLVYPIEQQAYSWKAPAE